MIFRNFYEFKEFSVWLLRRVFIIIVPITILIMMAATGCTDADGARAALTKAGFTNIEAGGYDWFACSDNDVFSTKFTATNPQGVRVEGVVCRGWFKDSTIRF